MARARMSELVALVAFAAIAVAVAAAGIRLGMLLAPRIDRLLGADEEEQGGDDD